MNKEVFTTGFIVQLLMIPNIIYGQLSVVPGNGGGKVMDNPKPQLKQKQSKHGIKWI
jgi:hypothetical protein